MSNMMPFAQFIDGARESRVGGDGVAERALADALARSAGALDTLRARHGAGSLPLLRLPERRRSGAAPFP